MDLNPVTIILHCNPGKLEQELSAFLPLSTLTHTRRVAHKKHQIVTPVVPEVSAIKYIVSAKTRLTEVISSPKSITHYSWKLAGNAMNGGVGS